MKVFLGVLLGAALALSVGAAEKPCVLVVNVDKAIDTAVMTSAVARMEVYLGVRVRSVELGGLDIGALVRDDGYVKKCVGSDGKVCVFLVKAPTKVLASPFSWAVVSASKMNDNMKKDSQPIDRALRLIYRGLAFASGCGVTVDRPCSMYYKAVMDGNLDMGGPGFSPGVYFPILEVLPSIGGPEIMKIENL